MSIETISINVTQKHINRGKPCDKKECPISLSLLDQGFLLVSVGRVYIRAIKVTPLPQPYLALNGETQEFTSTDYLGFLPDEGKSWIKRFDAPSKIRSVIGEPTPIKLSVEFVTKPTLRTKKTVKKAIKDIKRGLMSLS